MSELSVGQIIKMVVAVLVLVVVLSGVYSIFGDRIVLFFKGFAEQPKIDTESAFFKELLRNENIVATAGYNDGKNYVHLKKGGKTNYYFPKSSNKLREDIGFGLGNGWRSWFGGWDRDVGEIDRAGKIIIMEEFLNEELKIINGAYRHEGGLYKNG